MNTTFMIWLTVAAVVGGVLLLLLGMPVDEGAAPLVLENVPAGLAEPIEAQYWEPVAETPIAAQSIATRSQAATPYGPCGNVYPVPAAAACTPQPISFPCLQPVPSPCAPAPCSSLPTYCGTPCGSTCPLNRPGINRNMELCVDECTFVQLHATIPHPICLNVRFEWSASKGSFLDPTASDPLFYVPSTHFSGGEDVWVIVTITDGSGARYTDQIKLHVVNIR